jgi:hypothetical protein
MKLFLTDFLLELCKQWYKLPDPVPRYHTPQKPGRAPIRQVYSLSFINLTQKKPYASQILSYKIFIFCEQTLKIGVNDASGKMLQYVL